MDTTDQNRREWLLMGAAAWGLGALSDAASAAPPPPSAQAEKSATSDPFGLPALPYALDALQPHMSRETLEFHWGKHHKAYLDNLRGLVPAMQMGKAGLVGIVKSAAPDTPVFNNAAQAYNHGFFWSCLKPRGGGMPGPLVGKAIAAKWGSLKAFQEAFKKAALGNFGSGWTWLVQKPNGELEIVNTSNAGTPLTTENKPLLTLDVWEHAYYIDHRNARAKFVDAYLESLVNWEFAERNLGGTA